MDSEFIIPTTSITGPEYSTPDKIQASLEPHVSSTSAMPKKMWYKLGPKGLSDESRAWTDDCVSKNSDYEVEMLTEESGDTYVKEHFASRPDIVETYLQLSIPILKADLIRYMLLFNEGGVWNDLDISCGEIPMRDWVPSPFQDDTSVVVGLEFDVGWGDGFMRQFATWTVMAKPKSPHLMAVVEDALESVNEKSRERNVSISELAFDMIGDVVDLTGPRRMTRSILKSLGLLLNETIDDRNISLVLTPKLIGDVLVLPGYSFAAGSNRYEGGQEVGPPLVAHHYAGTWKNQHGGEFFDTL